MNRDVKLHLTQDDAYTWIPTGESGGREYEVPAAIAVSFLLAHAAFEEAEQALNAYLREVSR